MAELTRGQKRREYQKMYRAANKFYIQEMDKLYYIENK